MNKQLEKITKLNKQINSNNEEIDNILLRINREFGSDRYGNNTYTCVKCDKTHESYNKYDHESIRQTNLSKLELEIFEIDDVKYIVSDHSTIRLRKWDTEEQELKDISLRSMTKEEIHRFVDDSHLSRLLDKFISKLEEKEKSNSETVEKLQALKKVFN